MLNRCSLLNLSAKRSAPALFVLSLMCRNFPSLTTGCIMDAQRLLTQTRVIAVLVWSFAPAMLNSILSDLLLRTLEVDSSRPLKENAAQDSLQLKGHSGP